MTNKGPKDPFTRRAFGHYGRLALWEGHEIIEMTSPEIHLKVSLTRGAEILELRSKKLDLNFFGTVKKILSEIAREFNLLKRQWVIFLIISAGDGKRYYPLPVSS
jgi:hypothetical protein